MAFIYKKLFLNARSALAIGFYFFILFMVLIAGGSALTNNVVVTLKAGLLLVPLYACCPGTRWPVSQSSCGDRRLRFGRDRRRDCTCNRVCMDLADVRCRCCRRRCCWLPDCRRS